MEYLLLAATIIGIWLVLSHVRKQKFLKEYMDLQKKALEKGVEPPNDLTEMTSIKTNWADMVLRISIISLILGITGVLIAIYLLPGIATGEDADAPAIIASFKAIGFLLAAFGVGNLICWFLIDRRRNRSHGQGK